MLLLRKSYILLIYYLYITLYITDGAAVEAVILILYDDMFCVCVCVCVCVRVSLTYYA